MNTSKNYLVKWEIEVDANSPEEAAKAALTIQRDVESIATVFTVVLPDGTSKTVDPTDTRFNW